MEKHLEKSEGIELVEEIGWTYLLPENADTHNSSPTDHEFSASVRTAVDVGRTDVQRAYRVSVKSGQYSAFKTFTVDEEVGQHIDEVYA